MQPRPGVIVFDVNETLSDMTPLAARFADVGAPDVPDGVRLLRQHGLRLVTLSNGPAGVAGRLLTTAGLRGEFEHLLSVDDAAAWK